MPLRAPWLVVREGDRRRWGGDLRRRFIFDGLVERRHAAVVEGWASSTIERGMARLLAEQRRTRLRPRRLWVRPPLVASTEFLGDAPLDTVRRLGVPALVDVHDDQVEQNRAFGIPMPPAEEASLRKTKEANLDAFRWHVAQSPSFVALAGMDPRRTLIAPNGCETGHISVLPPPRQPVVGFISGAAPGRGIETLVDAVELARHEVPGLRLRMWLVATGEASQAYLEALTARMADVDWLTLGPLAYADLTEGLGSSSVLVVPNPPSRYWDTVLPIKLFDSLAAGRPVVVTPRTEMAQLVERHGVGLVARGDAAADLAEPLVRLARDPALCARLGSAARLAAETAYDWRIIGARLASELEALSSPWARLARRRPRSAA